MYGVRVLEGHVSKPEKQERKPDKLMAIGVRRQSDGLYAVFLVRRIAGEMKEEMWGRPSDSHLIAAGRMTDAILALGSEL